MYSLNPLYENVVEESFSKMIRKVSQLRPENQKKVLNQYAKGRFSKDGTLDNAATEFSKRYIKGKIKHAKHIANKNGRKLAINRVKNTLDSGNSPYPLNKNLLDKGEVTGTRVSNYIRNLNSDLLSIPAIDSRIGNKNIPVSLRYLTNANTVGHEKDELLKLYKLSKETGLTPSEITVANAINGYNKANSIHLNGVLDNEIQRVKLWKMMFGKDVFKVIPRTVKEVEFNRKPVIFKNVINKQPYLSISSKLKNMGYL